MTPFERALRERIRAHGPITLEAYMEACNSYYYATRDPLGARGDFTTAPEISQMFGELVGAALTNCWIRAGKPERTRYLELGPGKGTLAADALRLMHASGFHPEVQFLEASPVLRAHQRDRVPYAKWHESVEKAASLWPSLVVANEFLDALPVRQFVDGRERHVVLTPAGLAFDRDGEIIETSPLREQMVSSLAEMVVEVGGVALIIDYGHAKSAHGDTLQAVRSHQYAAVLANPGEQDLTSHVDFEAVANIARRRGAAVTPVVTQGQWLDRLGICARAEALARAHPGRKVEIETARRRLCDADQMGELFKVIAIHSPDWPRPAGFE